MKKKKKLYVLISLDVEEEGLFGGHYASKDTKVSNVALLKRLAPIWQTHGLPLTLFCSYSVFSNPSAQKTLEWMRDHCNAEIGAHLHHWSTPPFSEAVNENEQPERTHKLAPELLQKRLANLLQAGAEFQGAPLTCFRMGRWDLKSSLFPLLLDNGIKVDSSICPLRSFKGGADHFLAPSDPYFINIPGKGKILETPVTQIPISRGLAYLWDHLWRSNRNMADNFHYFGALSANPLWHGAAVMRLAAKFHTMRNGQVLNFFWHSSEMLPGGSPHIPDHAAAENLLSKIFSFCSWLKTNFIIEGITASQLPAMAFPTHDFLPQRDW